MLPPLLVAKALSLAITAVTVWFLIPHAGTSFADALANGYLRWDAPFYLRISEHGYPAHLDAVDAFLPGYPLLIAAGTLLTGDRVMAGIAINVVAEVIALFYVFRLVQFERDSASGRFGAWCVALAPLAAFFSAVYTESVFLAAAAASLYYARRGRFVAASVAGAIACSTRITGIALLPAVVWECVRQRRFTLVPVVIAVIPLPLIAFTVYMLAHTGDPLALLHANQVGFGHDAAPPWQGFAATWDTMTTASDPENRTIFIREIVFALLGAVACLAMWVWPRFPRSLALYSTAVVLMATSLTFWRSVPRYELAIFPLVIMLADLTRRDRWARRGLLVGSGLLSAAGIAIYSSGHWLG